MCRKVLHLVSVTINELKEAFSQLYAYTGFPRSLNALGVLSKVLEASPRGGLEGVWQEGKPWKRPAEWDDAKKAYEGKKASLGSVLQSGMMLRRLTNWA